MPSLQGRLAASAALLALFACNTDKGDSGDDKPVPDIGDRALRTFESCTEVRDYLADVMLETALNYKYSNWYWDVAEEDGGDGGGEPTDYTTTNVQEEGVDEPDLVKTDGSYIYAVQNNELTILDSWPAAETAVVSTLALEGYPYSMFLYKDLAVVFSYTYDTAFDGYYYGGTRIDLIDVTDRTAPGLLRSVDVEGYFADARLIEDQAYVVINTYLPLPDEVWTLINSTDLGLPEVDYDATEEERLAAVETARPILQPYIDAIAAGLDLDSVLPQVRDQVVGASDAAVAPLLSCTDLYRPADTAQWSVLDVLHLDLSDPTGGALDATGLVANGWTVYASSQNLYVGQTSWWWWWGWDALDLTTDIHQFGLGGGGPVTYEGSGSVDGWLLDQWSMSEHDGYLRVASSDVDWWWGTAEDTELGSRITVLQNQGGTLETVGEVSGIAPGEWIYASRMMGDKGYLVTFQQVDPLFTIDLSDPTNPTVVGSLETPGYSAYLHPVDEDHLLAVGMAGTEDGTITGLAVNLFDVSDFANPLLQQQYTLEVDDNSWSYSEALWDHHAFTFRDGVLSLPVYLYEEDGSSWRWFSGLLVLSVDVDAGISEIGRVDHADLSAEADCTVVYGEGCEDYSYAYLRRGLYIEDYLYSLSDVGLKVNELLDPETEVARVVFHPKE